MAAGTASWRLPSVPGTALDMQPWAPDTALDTAPSALDNIEHKPPFRPEQAAEQSLIAMLPVSLSCLLKPILNFCVVLSLHSY
jgi:hypothetical protein